MALLTPGEYAILKKASVHDRKSMYFVKLTDSAHRALANYLRNQEKCETPSIEFNKDEGRILISTSPKGTPDSDKCLAQFKFNVISNVAMQGTQGRFECVQSKRGQKQLLKFGQLTQRLMIHANEDVYETTKNRMAAIEQEQRKNCTVQLDWNSNTPVNRRVRLDNRTTNNPRSSYQPPEAKPVPEMTNVLRNKTRPVTNTLPQKLASSSMLRKPLKERIVHLLALRPYKKLELIDVLVRDGLRECDKPHLTSTLTSMTTIHDNTYHLAKDAWNNVQETWPFYSEQEKLLVKRNKLRNLTSPCSSDSGISVSSNQSPNSNAVAEKSPPNAYKRPGYFNGVDGFQTKRQRISHYVKPVGGRGNDENTEQKVAARFDEHITKPNSSLQKSSNNANRTLKPATDPDYSNRTFKPDPDYLLPFKEDVFETFKVGGSAKRPKTETDFTRATFRPDTDYCGSRTFKPDPSSDRPAKELHTATLSQSIKVEPECDEGHVSPPFPDIPSVVVTVPSSPMEPMLPNIQSRNSSLAVPSHPESKHIKPKYLKDYVTISNPVQRRKYKQDFEKIFNEYLLVHQRVDSVTNHFARLGETLKQHERGSAEYQKIEAKIIKKYQELKDKQFEAAKRRFEYLHEKLSHIKNLVHEYDSKMWK